MNDLSCIKCERTFVYLSTYVHHVDAVHLDVDAAWKLPKTIVEGVAEVPWLAHHRAKKDKDLINADAPGECGECPTDGYLLPAHPNCQCSPTEGWDEFLKGAKSNRPENWTEAE